MLARLAAIGIRSPRRVLLIGGALLVVAGVLGAPTPGLLQARNDFSDPGSGSAHARNQIERATGAGPFAEILALVDAGPRTPRAARVAAALRSDDELVGVSQPTGSRDGQASVISATLRAGVARNAAVSRIQQLLAPVPGVTLGGGAVAHDQLGKQASRDLGFAEALAFPLLAVLALLIFRGVAALLPMAVGGTSVLGAFVVLRAINSVFALSPFALNVVIGLGLGLAVDYSLFMVSRFREELAAGGDRATAVRATMGTAGRTVLFSSLTVAVALASLTVFPLRFLQSMGIGGAVVALVAALVSLCTLPALFMLLGGRIGRRAPGPVEQGTWYRLTHRVLARPGIVAAAVTVALLAFASPTLRVHWSGVDASALPTSQSARVVEDRLASEFPQLDASPAVVAVSAAPDAGPALEAYASRLRAVPGVRSVAAPRDLGSGTWAISVALEGQAVARVAQHAIASVRAVPAPFPADVTGDAAEFADQRAAISSGLPLALAILVLGTLSILWMLTDSVVLPVKALLMNALTVGAATGLLVLVFQDGRLEGPLGYTSQGGLEQSDFLVLAAIVFALSTDYGVFVLSRIKEARDGGASNDEAVAVGLQHSGSIVSAAAVLLAVALGAFATSQIVFLKEIGLGAVFAVLLDAFIVRALLVPSLMGLLGRWNWWSPRALHALHERIGISESGPLRAPAGA